MSAGDATIECAPTVLKTPRVLDLVAAGQRADHSASPDQRRARRR